MRFLKLSRRTLGSAAALIAVTVIGCASAGDDSDSSLGDSETALTANGPGAGKAEPGARPFRGGPDRFFNRWDSDADGKVELAALPEHAQGRLQPADADDDGALTREEMDQFHAARQTEFIKAADSDGDGEVDEEELQAFRAERQAKRFAASDADGDGALSESEVSKWRWSRLVAADADGDGLVTAAEHDKAIEDGKLQPRGPRGPGKGMHRGRGWKRGMGPGGPGMGPGGPGGPGMGPGPDRFFARWDSDGDGEVALSSLPAPARERLSEADANSDDILTRDEMQTFHDARRARFIEQADIDGDGEISKQERAGMRAKHRAARFAAKDRDGNGALTESEVGPRHWRHLQAADTDGDGQVTKQEIKQAVSDGTLRPPGPRGRGGPRGKGARRGPGERSGPGAPGGPNAR